MSLVIISELSSIASKMDVVVIVALITGTVSLLGVVISSIFSKVMEYRYNVKKFLYEKKEEPYSEFIEMVYKIQQEVKGGDEYSEDEIIRDTINFSKKLTLWGSNNVIKKWLVFRNRSTKKNIPAEETLFMLEDIIFEIRSDMGQKKVV